MCWESNTKKESFCVVNLDVTYELGISDWNIVLLPAVPPWLLYLNQ